MTRIRLLDIYQNIFPWRNINEFLSSIRTSIVYKSEDGSLVAIHKPFGVGIYKARDTNVKKQNQDKIFYQLNGTPKYCLQDAMEPLTDELNSDQPYKILKGIDRYTSGVVLISNNYKVDHESFVRSISTSKCLNLPSYRFRAITSGFPMDEGSKIKENIGVELVEVDELGDHKEPKIIKQPSNRFHNAHEKDKSLFQAELEVKKINRDLSVSLVDLYVSKTNWDFPRCYLSNKAAFILGDVHFSKRVREVLGTKVKLSPIKASYGFEQYEPLSDKLRTHLGVKANSQIPLMLDQYGIRLKNFYPKKPIGQRDLVIDSTYCPLHLRSTLDILKLGDLLN